MKLADITGEWISERFNYASASYGNWQRVCDAVEQVYKGDFDVKPDTKGADIEIVNPSEGARIVDKLLQMLAIRADIRYIVPRRTDTAKETAKADKMERVLKGVFRELEYETGRNSFRLGTHIALLRGRGCWHVRYNPNAEAAKIEVRAYDSYSVFPVFGPRGVKYFVREYWMTPMEVQMYFEGVTDKKLMKAKDAILADDTMSESVIQVVEYWDDKFFAWKIGGILVDKQEHGYGFCPYAEARFHDTVLDDIEWQARGVLFDVYNEIKAKAILKSKLATGVTQYFYPLMLYKSGDTMAQFDPFAGPGQFQEVDGDFQPIILNPTPNMDVAMLLKNELDEGIYNGTISKVAFVQDVPDVSGFLMSSILNVLQDQIADYRYMIERAASTTCSQILRIMEKFAEEQDDGAFHVLTEKGLEAVTADDIDGFYTVEVKIRVELPQDKLQMATIFNQLYQADPTSGMPRFDFETAMRISGLADVVGDMSAMQQRREFEFLLNTDQQARTLSVESIRAEHFPQLKDMEKQVEKAQARQEREEQRQIERDIDKGMTGGVILPEEIAQNQQLLEQLVGMTAQGVPIDQAVATLKGGALPLGVPGQQPQMEGGGDDANMMELLSALTGGGGPPQMADGMSGYEGIAPASLPPAMQGAMPRQVVDKDNVWLEQQHDTMRRGALPAAK